MRFGFVPFDKEPLAARDLSVQPDALERDPSRAEWRRQNEPKEGGLYEIAFLFAGPARIGRVRC
jgi:hypothetical protein